MRKFTLLFVVSFCILSIANAQITKGSLFLGGNAGVSAGTFKSATDTINTSNWNLQSSIGFAVKENTFTGINLGYGKATAGSTNADQHFYNAGFFFRKYKPLGKSFYLFGEANINYTHNKYEQDDQLGVYRLQKTNGVGLNVFPGVSFAASKIFYLEATLNNLFSLYYSKTNTETRTSPSQPLVKETGRNFGLGLGGGGNTIPINLGFRFIIPKK